MRMPMPSRSQRILLPPSIDEYVSADHPVRLIVEVVDRLDLSAFIGDDSETGRPSYPPEALVAVLLYAFSIGVFSSREIERRVETDCAFMFAVSGLRPSHRTLSRFRAEQKEALSAVFAQVVVVCRRAGLGSPELVVVDGTKQRANASLDAHSRRSQLEKMLAQARRHVEKLLGEAARVDAEEDAQASPAKDGRNARDRVAAIEAALKEMEDAGVEEVNTTDPDARIQRLKDGSRRPGYNAQIMVSGSDGIVLAADVTNAADDRGQLIPMRDQVVENLGEKPGCVLGDSGFESGENVRDLVDREQDAVLAAAVTRSAHDRQEKTGRFQWPSFEYDGVADEYICPAGRRLERVKTGQRRGKPNGLYRGVACEDCPLRSQCVEGDKPRTLDVLDTTPYLQAMSERRRVDRETEQFLKRRAVLVEGHFGHFKHNLRWRQFLARGLVACRAEFRLLCAAYNLRKLSRLRGVGALQTA